MNYCILIVVMIDFCDFIVVKCCVEIEILLFLGLKIVFIGGFDFNDYYFIWDCFDKVYVKYFDMVLLYGGFLRGVELIVLKWVSNCKVV